MAAIAWFDRLTTSGLEINARLVKTPKQGFDADQKADAAGMGGRPNAARVSPVPSPAGRFWGYFDRL
jgi:hypothetical protein